jgi:hypothetical protein
MPIRLKQVGLKAETVMLKNVSICHSLVFD